MPLTRRSRLKEVWRHPVGHDVLQIVLRQAGKTERWIESPLVANMTLQGFDRIAGAGFCDMLLEMAANGAQKQQQVLAQERTWWKQAVMYQIFLPSFMDSDHDGVGDLGGVVRRLPYLERLGVDTLVVWPVAQEDDRPEHNVRSYEKLVDSAGTMEEFKALAAQLHEREMRLVLGLDIAAVSEEHDWLEGDAGQAGEYVVLRPGTQDVPPNNWTRAGQGSAWRWLPQFSAWGLRLHGRNKLDLDWGSPALRARMAGVLEYWQRAGADGFCFGPVNLLSKSGYEDGLAPFFGAAGACGFEKYAYGPRLHRMLRELRTAVPAPALMMGEMRGVGTEIAKTFTATEKRELDMVVDPSHLSPRPKKAKKKSDEQRLELAELKDYYLQWMEAYGTERWMPLFLETPNTPRVVSRFGASPLYRAILAKLLATLLFTLRGTPILYQGQELGLANTRFTATDELRDMMGIAQVAELAQQLGEHAALQKLGPYLTDHARIPMPWSAGPNYGFTGAQPWMRLPDGAEYLNAAVQMEDGASVWQHTQKLISLRKKSTCLVYGAFSPVFVKSAKTFCYFRLYEGEKWYVEMNLTEREVGRPGRITPSHRLMLSNYDETTKALRPYEANLYRCD